MRRLLSLLFFSFSFVALHAQSPELINYQGVARNVIGNVLANQNISLRLSVRDSITTGTVIYRETRNVRTNAFGLFVVPIGSTGATISNGQFSQIDWGNGKAKFLQVEIDPTGSTGYIDMGTSQLLSVPYAMYASKATPAGKAEGDLDGSYPAPRIKANAVTTATIKDGAITLAKLDPSIVVNGGLETSTAGGDLIGIYPNPSIKPGAVTAEKVGANAITSEKISNGAVTSSKIQDGAIIAIKLADGSVLTAKIADAAITTTKLANGAVTDEKIAAVAYGKITGAPTALPPNGTAGGDLSGTYPAPLIKNGAVNAGKIAGGAVTTDKIADGAVTAEKLAPGLLLGGSSTSGAAGGDLTGTYPNPGIANGVVGSSKITDGAVTTGKVADGAITAGKIADGTITVNKLAAGVIPTALPPTGTAGGDLTGTYPNPAIAIGAIGKDKIADGAISNAKLEDNAISTAKVQDGAITADKLAPGLVSNGPLLSGQAGGDLTGTYPNPSIANGVITSNKIANGTIVTPKLADGAVTKNKLADAAVATEKIADGAVTAEKLAPGLLLGGGGSISGAAGGDLTGFYPNPLVTTGAITTTKLANGAVTDEKIAAVTYSKITGAPTALPPNGTAGGDLSGTYPNPLIAGGSVTAAKLSDGAVTTGKVADGAITAAKLASGVIPAALPPSGAAGGDLSGNYPAPSVKGIMGRQVSATAPVSGQVLKFDGSQWAPATDNSGSFVLPYSGTHNATTSAVAITNQGSGAAIEGFNTSINANVSAIVGKVTATNAGAMSAGIKGMNSSTGANGIGVWGDHAGSGYGVYGASVKGSGVYGNAVDGFGVMAKSDKGQALFAESNNGNAAFFDISNVSNPSDALFVTTRGAGNGIFAKSESSNGIMSVTENADAYGLFSFNNGGGVSIQGVSWNNNDAAIIGYNGGTNAGVKGMNVVDNGIGVLALANANSAVNGTALVAALESGTGNTAVFKTNNANVARIDHTGKAFFNGGTQVGGADVAEYFDVQGSVSAYEAGDVLAISQTSDRQVEKSSKPYSTLVAGVYATKPGLMLTEKNAEQDQLGNMVPMGVMGVIPTKVCTEGGSIKRGDLIVTSSLPGVAMKGDPDKVKIGQVIGKALQDYNGGGIGKINVLVSIK